jgi:pilus assembly protein TadC
MGGSDNKAFRRAEKEKNLKSYFFECVSFSTMVLFSFFALMPYKGSWEWPLPWPVNLIYAIALLLLLFCIFKVFKMRHTLWKQKDDDDLN